MATAELESNWTRLARPKYYKRFRGKGSWTQLLYCLQKVQSSTHTLPAQTSQSRFRTNASNGETATAEADHHEANLGLRSRGVCRPLNWANAGYAHMALSNRLKCRSFFQTSWSGHNVVQVVILQTMRPSAAKRSCSDCNLLRLCGFVSGACLRSWSG